MNKIAVIMSIVLLTGCSLLGLEPPPSVCDQPEAGGSVICGVCDEIGVNVEDVDLLIQIAALRVLDEHGRRVAVDFYDSVEAFLAMDRSYAALLRYVQQYIDITGPEILIISRYLPMFDSPLRISDFDRDLLLIHIERTRALLDE